MSFLARFRAWWNKDRLERAQEETQMTPVERDRAEEDFEARKDDVAVREFLAEDGAGYERDSEPPP